MLEHCHGLKRAAYGGYIEGSDDGSDGDDEGDAGVREGPSVRALIDAARHFVVAPKAPSTPTTATATPATAVTASTGTRLHSGAIDAHLGFNHASALPKRLEHGAGQWGARTPLPSQTCTVCGVAMGCSPGGTHALTDGHTHTLARSQQLLVLLL